MTQINNSSYTKDITHFDHNPGARVFPISLAKVLGDLSPDSLKQTIYTMKPKVRVPGVSAFFVSGDGLYQKYNRYNEDGEDNYAKRENISENFSKRLLKELTTPPTNSLIDPINIAYTQLLSRSQMRFLSIVNLHECLLKVQDHYHKDTEFQELMRLDAHDFDRELTDVQRDFFLEEHMIMTLIARKKIIFRNTITPNIDWQLLCYPGAPLRHQVYMMQNNIGLGQPKQHQLIQTYENGRYNTLTHQLYDMSKINVDTYNPSSLDHKA